MSNLRKHKSGSWISEPNNMLKETHLFHCSRPGFCSHGTLNITSVTSALMCTSQATWAVWSECLIKTQSSLLQMKGNCNPVVYHASYSTPCRKRYKSKVYMFKNSSQVARVRWVPETKATSVFSNQSTIINLFKLLKRHFICRWPECPLDWMEWPFAR